MTINDVAKLKREIESTFLEALLEFKDATGLSVQSIDVKYSSFYHCGEKREQIITTGVSINIERI